ncbi:hypothetical protein KSP40_PGU016933 [Platanthera guangdongensis]|uniref:Uncharacterized protein n=1 Tax=Platanthera guangdongensis TaxID=2320717 RepID=A0ABR2LR26_9ASPA
MATSIPTTLHLWFNSLNRGDDVGVVSAQQLRQPEIRHLRPEILIHQDVLRLDVAVNDSILVVLVEVGDPLHDRDGDLHAGSPFQESVLLVVWGKYSFVQGAVAHVLVHQESACITIAQFQTFDRDEDFNLFSAMWKLIWEQAISSCKYKEI